MSDSGVCICLTDEQKPGNWEGLCVIKGAAVSFELGGVQPNEGLSVKLD